MPLKNSTTIKQRVRACMRACVRAGVRAGVRACVRECGASVNSTFFSERGVHPRLAAGP